MRIGLDFDNTLVCYDHVFASESKNIGVISKSWHGSKKELQEELLSRHDGKKIWQTLQGQVYGPCMNQAKLFPGVAKFLMRSKQRGEELFIVSHKTEFGHFDTSQTPLRGASLNWMESKGFFNMNRFGIDIKKIFFENTRKEKVERIASLKLDIFVDDLEEVFEEEGFPDIKKILFSSASRGTQHDKRFENWRDLEREVLGPMTDNVCKSLAQTLCSESIKKVYKLKGRGNSMVYKIINNSGKEYALKFYPDLHLDSRPRLQTELRAFQLLKPLKITPEVVSYDDDLNIGLYKWVKGKDVDKIENCYLDQAITFVNKLKDLSTNSPDGFFQASEACLSLNQLFSQVNCRIHRLESVHNDSLDHFFKTTLKPLWNEVREWSQLQWPNKNIEVELKKSLQILSPSDFGFHNSLLQSSGKLFFLDMEYFGWDDPAKLIADFIWHPAMDLEQTHKTKWVKEMFDIFSKDIELQSRFYASWPVYGLRWALILLNEFNQDGWRKRLHADQNLEQKLEQKLREQLQKSSNICLQIQNQNFKCIYC